MKKFLLFVVVMFGVSCLVMFGGCEGKRIPRSPDPKEPELSDDKKLSRVPLSIQSTHDAEWGVRQVAEESLDAQLPQQAPYCIKEPTSGGEEALVAELQRLKTATDKAKQEKAKRLAAEDKPYKT